MRFLFVLIFILFFSTSKVFAWGKLGGGVRFSPNLSFVSFKGDELTVKINEDLFRSFAKSILINGDFFVERKFKKVAFGTGIGFRRLSEQTDMIKNVDGAGLAENIINLLGRQGLLRLVRQVPYV